MIVLLMEPASKDGSLPSNPFIVSRSLKEAVGSIDSAYRDRAKNLVIRVRSEKKAEKLLQLQELIDETKVKVTEHPKLNQSRCIVTCHSVSELTDEELQVELEDQGVTGVHRFLKKGARTNTMVITTRGTVAPKEIAFGYEICRTRPYKDSPMQCFRCYSFGHTKAKCGSERETCRNCSGDHPIQKDEEGKTICDNPPKCKNCTGKHSPATRACPRYAEEEKILEIRAKNDVSPREARRMYEEEKAAANSSYAAAAKTGAQQNEAQTKAEHTKLRKELDDLKKAVKNQVEEAKRTLQVELDATKTALAQAKQEILRLKASAKNAEEANRKRKVSESGSRSDESDSSEGPNTRDDDETLRRSNEAPFKLQHRKDGSTVKPPAHNSADRSVVPHPAPSKTKPSVAKTNDDETTTTTTTTTKTKPSKKKKKAISKKLKNGELDGEDTEQNSEMEL